MVLHIWINEEILDNLLLYGLVENCGKSPAHFWPNIVRGDQTKDENLVNLSHAQLMTGTYRKNAVATGAIHAHSQPPNTKPTLQYTNPTT